MDTEPTKEQLLNRLAAAGLDTLQKDADTNPEQFDAVANAAGLGLQPMPQQSPVQPSVPEQSAQPTTPQSTYTGPSITDYLTSIGKPSDVNSRAQLAFSSGLVSSPAEYISLAKTGGNARINTQLLEKLRTTQGGVETLPGKQQEQTQPTASQNTTETDTAISTITESPVDKILSQYGIQKPQPGVNPIKSFVDTYKGLFSELGLGDIKSRYDELVNEETKLKTEMNDEITDINQNPWLSEGIRAAQVKKVQERYETKLDSLTNRLKLTDSLYQQGLDQVKFISQQAYDNYYQDPNLNQDYVMKAMDIAQKQAEAEKKLMETKPANFKEVQGGLYDISTGSWVVEPKPEKAPKATDSELDLGAVRDIERQLISRQGEDKYTDPNFYASLRQKARISPSEFDSRFGYLVNPLSKGRLGITGAESGDASEQFLNRDWFKKTYTTDVLYRQATAAGKGKGLFGSKEAVAEEYLDDLEKTINAYREAGFTDQEILKMMK